MKKLLNAVLNKEPQNTVMFTPRENVFAFQLQYKNGMVVEVVEADGKSVLKLVELQQGNNGQQVAKLKAHFNVTESADVELLAAVKEKWFSAADQENTADHWALMINGSKNGLVVTKK